MVSWTCRAMLCTWCSTWCNARQFLYSVRSVILAYLSIAPTQQRSTLICYHPPPGAAQRAGVGRSQPSCGDEAKQLRPVARHLDYVQHSTGHLIIHKRRTLINKFLPTHNAETRRSTRVATDIHIPRTVHRTVPTLHLQYPASSIVVLASSFLL